jgi:hypothetical protein
MVVTIPKADGPSGTLRGYSTAIEPAEERELVFPKEAARVDAVPVERSTKADVSRPRGGPTRPLWTRGGVRPSSVAARGAFEGLMNMSSKIDQQLAFVEMLLAVGPEVRDQGALEEALGTLESIEIGLSADLEKLLRACAAVRADAAGSEQRSP